MFLLESFACDIDAPGWRASATSLLELFGHRCVSAEEVGAEWCRGRSVYIERGMVISGVGLTNASDSGQAPSSSESTVGRVSDKQFEEIKLGRVLATPSRPCLWLAEARYTLHVLEHLANPKEFRDYFGGERKNILTFLIILHRLGAASDAPQIWKKLASPLSQAAAVNDYLRRQQAFLKSNDRI